MAFEREKVRAIIFTTEMEIHGFVHIPPGGRLTDFLNNISKPFIPITDADIKTKDNQKIHTDLLQLNKDYVIAIIPQGSVTSEID